MKGAGEGAGELRGGTERMRMMFQLVFNQQIERSESNIQK